MKDKLIGELIGLARCTDGNEHLINPSATDLIVNALSAVYSGADNMVHFIGMVDAEKRKMVPDCFLCASPCGKNNAFDMDLLSNDTPDVHTLKKRILSEAQKLAEHIAVSNSSELYGSDLERLLYKALIIIGMDGLNQTQVQPFVNEMEQISKSQ